MAFMLKSEHEKTKEENKALRREVLELSEAIIYILDYCNGWGIETYGPEKELKFFALPNGLTLWRDDMKKMLKEETNNVPPKV